MEQREAEKKQRKLKTEEEKRIRREAVMELKAQQRAEVREHCINSEIGIVVKVNRW